MFVARQKSGNGFLSYRGLYSPQRESTPNPDGTTPQNQSQKFGMFQRCIKWQKSWKMGEKIG